MLYLASGRHDRQGEDTMSYNDWRAQVDKYCWNIAELSIDDLPDVPLYDWYERKVSSKTAARRALRSAGYR